MLEGKALMALGAGVALLGTLASSSGLAGPTRTDLVLAVGAIVALTLCRSPKRP